MNKRMMQAFKLFGQYKTGWPDVDAIMYAKCPKCQSDIGFYCENPSGTKYSPPHQSRMQMLGEHYHKLPLGSIPGSTLV